MALGFLEEREQEGVVVVLGGSPMAEEAASGMLVEEHSGKHSPTGTGGRWGS